MSESAVENLLTPSGSQRPKRRARLNAKRKLTTSKEDDEIKRRRTFDTFYTFCNFVLEYEQKLASESMPVSAISPPSPVNSAGESSTSSTPSSSDTSSNGSDASDGADGEGEGQGDAEESKLEYTSDDESWNLVTCFCRRPFAGRPMIECSGCKTWIHLFCARVKKDHVPDVYYCPTCKQKSSKTL